MDLINPRHAHFTNGYCIWINYLGLTILTRSCESAVPSVFSANPLILFLILILIWISKKTRVLPADPNCKPARIRVRVSAHLLCPPESTLWTRTDSSISTDFQDFRNSKDQLFQSFEVVQNLNKSVSVTKFKNTKINYFVRIQILLEISFVTFCSTCHFKYNLNFQTYK